MEYRLHRSGGSCDVVLNGNDILSAIEGNFKTIAGEARMGNAAGYKLISATVESKSGVLGGKGGVEITLKHRGQDLAHKPASETVSTSMVWIHAEEKDLPEKHTFVLRND